MEKKEHHKISPRRKGVGGGVEEGRPVGVCKVHKLTYEFNCKEYLIGHYFIIPCLQRVHEANHGGGTSFVSLMHTASEDYHS